MGLEYLAGEGGIDLLGVNPGLVFWTVITFTLVLIVLRVFAWKPIANALDARAQKIHDDIDRAESVRAEAEQKLDEYMGKLNASRQEGQDIIAEARKDAENLKNEIMEEARKEAEALKARGLRDVQLAMDKALEEYHKNITDLSVSIAGQILNKTLKPEDHKQLISDSIESFKSLN